MGKVEKERVKAWKEIIKRMHNVATGYNPDDNLRSDGELEYMIFEALRKAYPSMEEAAAFFMHQIATKHPFYDGNKRTSLMTFLVLRYIELEFGSIAEKIRKHFPKSWDNKDDKIVKFMLELAEYKHGYKEVLEFVRETFK